MKHLDFSDIFPWSPDTRTIWRYYGAYSPLIEVQNRITLDEGGTPLSSFHELAKELNLISFYFKREDLNPTGSQKDRCAAYQISWARQFNHSIVTISSSGNAAISTAAYCARAGVNLIAHISPQTNPQKIARIQDFGATVLVSDEPIKNARYTEKVHGIPNLRPSTNLVAIEGYKSIGYEILEARIPVDAIFLYVSSASTLVGIAEAFATYQRKNPEYTMPQLHAVQAGLVSSLAEEWGLLNLPKERSVIGDLGVKQTKRTAEALKNIRSSKGSVWYVEDADIQFASKKLLSMGIDTSTEGAAAFAGVMKASNSLSLNNNRHIICLLTGRSYQIEKEMASPGKLFFVDNFSTINQIITDLKKDQK